MTIRKTFLAVALTLGVSSVAYAGNSATVVQIGGINKSSISQNGRVNRATTIQDGWRNKSKIRQRGKKNIAAIGQVGRHNKAKIKQRRRRR